METLTVSKNVIAERAFEIFKSRGGKHGSDLDDWLHAEKELSRSGLRGTSDSFQTKKNRNSNNKHKFDF